MRGLPRRISGERAAVDHGEIDRADDHVGRCARARARAPSRRAARARRCGRGPCTPRQRLRAAAIVVGDQQTHLSRALRSPARRAAGTSCARPAPGRSEWKHGARAVGARLARHQRVRRSLAEAHDPGGLGRDVRRQRQRRDRAGPAGTVSPSVARKTSMRGLGVAERHQRAMKGEGSGPGARNSRPLSCGRQASSPIRNSGRLADEVARQPARASRAGARRSRRAASLPRSPARARRSRAPPARARCAPRSPAPRASRRRPGSSPRRACGRARRAARSPSASRRRSRDAALQHHAAERVGVGHQHPEALGALGAQHVRRAQRARSRARTSAGSTAGDRARASKPSTSTQSSESRRPKRCALCTSVRPTSSRKSRPGQAGERVAQSCCAPGARAPARTSSATRRRRASSARTPRARARRSAAVARRRGARRRPAGRRARSGTQSSLGAVAASRRRRPIAPARSASRARGAARARPSGARARRRRAAEHARRARVVPSLRGSAQSAVSRARLSTRSSSTMRFGDARRASAREAARAVRSSSETRLDQLARSRRAGACLVGSLRSTGRAAPRPLRSSASRSSGFCRKSRAPARIAATARRGVGARRQREQRRPRPARAQRARARSAASGPELRRVGDHDVGRAARASASFERARLGLDRAHGVARLGQQALDEAPEVELVVDRQDPRLGSQALSSVRAAGHAAHSDSAGNRSPRQSVQLSAPSRLSATSGFSSARRRSRPGAEQRVRRAAVDVDQRIRAGRECALGARSSRAGCCGSRPGQLRAAAAARGRRRAPPCAGRRARGAPSSVSSRCSAWTLREARLRLGRVELAQSAALAPACPGAPST